jgi:hypothetical protein
LKIFRAVVGRLTLLSSATIQGFSSLVVSGAFPHLIESLWIPLGGLIVIQDSGWAEASIDGQTSFE